MSSAYDYRRAYTAFCVRQLRNGAIGYVTAENEDTYESAPIFEIMDAFIMGESQKVKYVQIRDYDYNNNVFIVKDLHTKKTLKRSIFYFERDSSPKPGAKLRKRYPEPQVYTDSLKDKQYFQKLDRLDSDCLMSVSEFEEAVKGYCITPDDGSYRILCKDDSGYYYSDMNRYISDASDMDEKDWEFLKDCKDVCGVLWYNK